MTGIYAHYACGMLIIKRAINMKNCLSFLPQTNRIVTNLTLGPTWELSVGG